MALTLIEASKLYLNDLLRGSVIELYAQNSEVLRTLPFMDITGPAYHYLREETLPGIGFRGINEAYTESTGVMNPEYDPLVIAGGDLDVDNFLLTTMGAEVRARHEAMKVKALAGRWTKAFIKGDSSTEPREFDGLQRRLTGTQKISAGSTSGGSALSLAKLDEAIDAVDNPTHLIMNRTMRRRLSAAARLTTVGGYLTYGLDEFGRRVTHYNDLPILIVDQDNTGSEIMGFDEAAAAGGATASSIYVVSFGDMMLQGIQSGVMDVRDLGEQNSASVKRTRVEWFSGICVEHPRAASRLWSIGDLAVVA
jgi:hypothetical protein